RAKVPMLDRIFTRIGAADDLIGGQSTFMVEMADIQVMTDKATPRSLIIIDELGRGTSTSEGMAIAQAVIEFVHDTIGCKALVSTHFHELAHLEQGLSSLRNYSMAVQESGDKVNFLRKLIPGAASSSYGIYCARLAGLPNNIIERANGLLNGFEQAAAQVTAGTETVVGGKEGTDLRTVSGTEDISSLTEYNSGQTLRESGETASSAQSLSQQATLVKEDTLQTVETSSTLEQGATEVVQLSIFGEQELAASKPHAETVEANPIVRQILRKVKNADVMNMTPLQAMQLLNDLKNKANGL
ncbi:DNA mismatch repair protein MutS, partial [Paenibacillus sp. OT2-17]|nr:DNA mismatch repair protein MutS [Paenibacillus sp. OT2-17]